MRRRRSHRGIQLALGIAAGAAASFGCSSASSPSPTEAAPHSTLVAPDSAAPAPALLPAPSASASSAPPVKPIESRTERLEVQGFAPSVVVTPSTDRRGAPLVIVGHGAGGRPEPHCERYKELVRGRGFILCTAGRAMDKQLPEEERGYFYDGHHELGKEVVLALDALAKRYGDWVDLQGSIYGGYSQGATMGILYLQQGGAVEAKTAGILLVEGGSAEWTIGLAKKLKREGVRRVEIVCGQTSCAKAAKMSKAWITKAELDVATSYAEGAGHTYGGSVAPLVEQAFDRLVADDPRWR